MIGIEAAFDSVEEIIDFSIPNQVQYFYWEIGSDPNPVDLSKYWIQSGLRTIKNSD